MKKIAKTLLFLYVAVEENFELMPNLIIMKLDITKNRNYILCGIGENCPNKVSRKVQKLPQLTLLLQ